MSQDPCHSYKSGVKQHMPAIQTLGKWREEGLWVWLKASLAESVRDPMADTLTRRRAIEEDSNINFWPSSVHAYSCLNTCTCMNHKCSHAYSCNKFYEDRRSWAIFLMNDP